MTEAYTLRHEIAAQLIPSGGRHPSAGWFMTISCTLSRTAAGSFIPTPVCLFALKHFQRRDGHDFIPEAYKARCPEFHCQQGRSPSRAFSPGQGVLLVDDTFRALGLTWRRFTAPGFQLPVIGIHTGSNGKTIVKEWLLYQLLQSDYRIVRSPRSYNSQIGVPLSVWQIRPRRHPGNFRGWHLSSRNGDASAGTIILQPHVRDY